MYKYQVCFPFKGIYHFINLTSIQLANAVIDHTDDVADFVYSDKKNYLNEIIEVEGKKYEVTFSLESPKFVNVYEYDDEGGGLIVEKNIPWQILKVISDTGEELYNLTDCI